MVAYKTGMEFDRKALGQLADTADRYHLGITDATADYLATRGITGAIIDQFKLGTCDDIHQGWLSIPYLRPSGVIGIKYRRITSGSPKYLNSGGTHLFNTADLDVADQSGEIAIAEGEIDAITASALAGVPCVGIPGATNWTGHQHWHELFRGYQRIWVLADPDGPGLELAAAIMDTLPAARLVRLPADVNDTYLIHGGIREFIK